MLKGHCFVSRLDGLALKSNYAKFHRRLKYRRADWQRKPQPQPPQYVRKTVFQWLRECRVSLAFNILGGGFLTDTVVLAMTKAIALGG